MLKRNGTDQSFINNVSMPPSRYTVHAYDLEENGLPNPHPANLDEQTVIINGTGECKYLVKRLTQSLSVLHFWYNLYLSHYYK